MPRRARIALAGIPWHIIQRGHNRSACFYTEQDYRYYLRTLADQARKHDCAIHAYVLMTNHIHLLLTPETIDGASMLMKHLGQRYVQYINRTYRRTGTLWEGRFRSCLAQDDLYALACYRYIELNPVRAGIVKNPEDYPWSSYRVNCLGKTDAMISPHDVYQALGNSIKVRVARYRALFNSEIHPTRLAEIRQATNGNYVLGNGRFRNEIRKMLNRRVEPGQSGRPPKQSASS